jgi:lysophospholipid acyltransferase (LPLAT)-like uncharacterized protein
VFLATYFWQRRAIVVMTSRSFDGEYIARFIQRFGYGAARGSSSRGATGAVVEMVRLMRAGCATAFTIDGPRGPRYVAKMGAVLLAKKTGNPILPFTVVAKLIAGTVPKSRSCLLGLPFSSLLRLMFQRMQVKRCSIANVTNYKLRSTVLIDGDARSIRGESWSKRFNYRPSGCFCG